MKNYYVEYEMGVQPMPVTVRLKCLDEAEQTEIYNDRRTNSNLMNVKKYEETTDLVLRPSENNE